MSLACSPSFASTPVPGGNVSGTWALSGSPYLVQGSIMVPADSTLVIQAGVTVNFQGHYKFLVLGTLLALGTETSGITITSPDHATGWFGLRFDGTDPAADSSILRYCTLSYGRSTDPDDLGGAVYINGFSKIRIDHCSILNNYAALAGGGIYAGSADPLIINNDFEWNTADFAASYLAGGGALCLDGSNALVSGNTFKNNSSSSGVGGGGAIFSSDGQPLITGNIITNNTNTNNAFYGDGGGGGIFISGSARLTNNTISNNSSTGYVGRGGGIYLYWHCKSVLTGNTITNNNAVGSVTAGGGGLFFFIDCHDTLTNNTVANNLSNGGGGALYCYSNASPVFRNCIFYGNLSGSDTNQVYLYSEDCDPDFYYSDVQKGKAGFSLNGNFYTGKYEHNIDQKPLFAWPSGCSGTGCNGSIADWALLSPSPCINSGDTSGNYPATDKAGNPRVVNGIIDMGAYEYLYAVGLPETTPKLSVSISPDPVGNSAVMRFSETLSRGVLLITDCSGREVLRTEGIEGSSLFINCSGLPQGMYLFILTSEGRAPARGRFLAGRKE